MSSLTDDYNAADHTRVNEPMLRYFSYDHLRADLQQVSRHFYDLAHFICACGELPRSAERTVCLRKLLEAKDAAVRAKVYP